MLFIIDFAYRERPKEDVSVKDCMSFEAESLQNSFDGRASLDSNAVSSFLCDQFDMHLCYNILIIFRLASNTIAIRKLTQL